MTITKIWYHPFRKTKVDDWGSVGQLPDGKDLADLFETFVRSDITNDSLVRLDRESYAMVTDVERKNRAIVVTTEAGRFGEEGAVKNVKTHERKGDFTREDATIVTTHGVLLVPKAGNAALVFSERSAGQGGMTALLGEFIDRFNAVYPGHRMKKSAVVEQEAWLKRAKLTKVVGTVRKYNTDEATDGKERVVGELQHTLVPERDAKYFPRALWEKLREGSINKAKFLNFTDETELDTFDVTASDGARSKTFAVGEEKTPPMSLVVTQAGEAALKSPKILKLVLDEAAAIFKDQGIEWSEADAITTSST